MQFGLDWYSLRLYFIFSDDLSDVKIISEHQNQH